METESLNGLIAIELDHGAASPLQATMFERPLGADRPAKFYLSSMTNHAAVPAVAVPTL